MISMGENEELIEMVVVHALLRNGIVFKPFLP
jgi:hypothetical protein